MGSMIARMLVEKGATIVGAIARSPQQLGRDVGDLAGLSRPLGVTVTTDIDAVLAETKPDIVVMTIASFMNDMYPNVLRCLQAGANVISLSEELLYSWITSPAETAKLDAAARENNVTFACSGHQDAYWVNLIAVMMGSAHTIDNVRGLVEWNVDDFGVELANLQQVGRTPAEFDTWNAQAQRPPTFGRTSLQSLVAVAGLHPLESTTETRPVFASTDLKCKALGVIVPVGNVIGFTDIDTVTTEENVTLTMEMTGKVFTDEEADVNEWRTFGEPNLTLINTDLHTHHTTCATLVNRIPDVIGAAPGFATLDKLPQLTFRQTLA
jgi:4-hydroxy-tetrahydrodipicolinate reductase